MTQEMIHYQQRLSEFVASRTTCFSIGDALEYLGLEPDADGTHHAIPAIANALVELGCTRNYVNFDGYELVAYFAPNQPMINEEDRTCANSN